MRHSSRLSPANSACFASEACRFTVGPAEDAVAVVAVSGWHTSIISKCASTEVAAAVPAVGTKMVAALLQTKTFCLFKIHADANTMADNFHKYAAMSTLVLAVATGSMVAALLQAQPPLSY